MHTYTRTHICTYAHTNTHNTYIYTRAYKDTHNHTGRLHMHINTYTYIHIRTYKHTHTTIQVVRVFQEMDRNKDGRISIAEFKAHFGLPEDLFAQAKAIEKMHVEAEKMFADIGLSVCPCVCVWVCVCVGGWVSEWVDVYACVCVKKMHVDAEKMFANIGGGVPCVICVCLSVCMSVCLSVCLSVCPYVIV